MSHGFPFRAQTCNFDTLYAWVEAILTKPGLHHVQTKPLTHLLAFTGTSRRPTTTSAYVPHPMQTTHPSPPPSRALTPRFVRAQYDRAKNLRPKRNIKTAMNNEIMLYGIAQKEQLGAPCSLLPCCAHPLFSTLLIATALCVQVSTRPWRCAQRHPNRATSYHRHHHKHHSPLPVFALAGVQVP